MQPRTGAEPPRRPPGYGRWGTAAALRAASGCLAAVLLAAGCSAGSESPPGAGGSPPAAQAAGGKGAHGDGQAALAAYTAMWDEAAAASHEGGGATGELDRYATGAALLLLREALAGSEDMQVTGEPELDPEVEIEGGGRADITDCLDDSGWSLGTAASASGPRRVEAGLVHDGLAWRVSELRIWEPGTC